MAFINRFTTNTRGAITITGNTLGLCKAAGTLNPGLLGSIGAFTTTNNLLPVPAAWAGVVNLGANENVTFNWPENSSSAFLNIPAGGTVLYAELIWGAQSYSPITPVDVRPSVNNSISFTTPAGTFPISPDPVTAIDVTSIDGVVFYSRSANVTPFVLTGGSGKYTTGGVPAALDPLSNVSNCAGWALIVAYRQPTFVVRNLTIFAGGTFVEIGATEDATISGFMTPASGPLNARASVSSLEGDAIIPGDFMQAGPNFGSLTKLFGPNNPAIPPDAIDNFFACQINNGDPTSPNVGLIDTTGTFGNRNSNAFTATDFFAGRQGWELTNVNASDTIVYMQSSSVIRFASNGDRYFPNGIGLQTTLADPLILKAVDKSYAKIGDILTYTVTLENQGTDPDNLVFFQDPTPSGTSYVSLSLTVDAAFSGTDPDTGITITTISPAQVVTITWQVKVTEIIPIPNPIANVATATIPGFDPQSSNTVTTLVFDTTRGIEFI